MVSIDNLDFIAAILTSVASGVMLTIVSILFLDLITRSRAGKSNIELEQGQKKEQETLGDMYIRKLRAREMVERKMGKLAPVLSDSAESIELESGSVRTTDGETVSISAVGRADLDKRVAQRRNYKASEVAELLGVAASTVGTWLGKGYLQSIVASDKTRWVTAASVAGLLDKLGVEPPRDAEPIVEALSESETAEGEPVIRVPIDVRSGQENTTKEPSNDKPSGHQWYKYYVDGGKSTFATLREAVIAAGVRVPEGQPITWSNIGSVIRHRIKRVRL